MSTNDEAAAVREYVRDRDAACPGCGYNVRGLEEDSCPECGARLRLSLGRAPRSWAWVFGLMGLGVGTLMLVVGLAALVVQLVAEEWFVYPEAVIAAAVLFAGVLIQCAALARWLAGGGDAGPWRAALAWLFGGGVGAVAWLALAVVALV